MNDEKYEPKHRGEPAPPSNLSGRYWLTEKGEQVVAQIRKQEAESEEDA